MNKINFILARVALTALASTAMVNSVTAFADQVIQDDLVVVGSQCIGMDCVNGEGFGFDTLRLKENNLRIKFQDTSGSSSFPSRDWQITVNDSANGGLNHFSIDDVDAATTPFTIAAGAPTSSLYVSSGGRIGVGTSAPIVDIHTVNGNTPTLRLEQNGSSGFSPQQWDVGANETNFFIRDGTGSTLPFRIATGAPNSSLYVASDGDIGFQTTTPDGLIDVAHPTNGNNHAFLISPSGDVGINIDNGFIPNAIFDVQTTGGLSHFNVTQTGYVGIGVNAPDGLFDVAHPANTDNHAFLISPTGNVGINIEDGELPTALFDIQTTGGVSLFNVTSDGTVGIGVLNVTSEGSIGIGVATAEINSDYTLQASSGAHLTKAGVWINASSRLLKNDVLAIGADAALSTLKALNPVTFSYKIAPTETYAGFIAEDVPEMVATNDRKGLAAMDIVAVLTKVLQQQQAVIENLQGRLSQLEDK